MANIFYQHFETDYWLNNGLTARFECGESMKDLYAYFPKVVNNFLFDLVEKNGFYEILDYTIKEWIILRAGIMNSITSNTHINEINVVNFIDMKRSFDEEKGNFKARIINNPKETKENVEYRIDIFSDVCAASGSTMEEWFCMLLNDYYKLINKKWIIVFNLNVITQEAIDRIINNIPSYLDERVSIYFLSWGGIFRTIDAEHILLTNGEEIPPYTLINDYWKEGESKVLPETRKKLESIYGKTFLPFYDENGDFKFLPDIVGECGDKMQDSLGALFYDLMEFEASCFDFKNTIWEDKIKRCINFIENKKQKELTCWQIDYLDYWKKELLK